MSKAWSGFGALLVPEQVAEAEVPGLARADEVIE
jgi:hypothetical protein